jgi:hypothetical protein
MSQVFFLWFFEMASKDKKEMAAFVVAKQTRIILLNRLSRCISISDLEKKLESDIDNLRYKTDKFKIRQNLTKHHYDEIKGLDASILALYFKLTHSVFCKLLQSKIIELMSGSYSRLEAFSFNQNLNLIRDRIYNLHHLLSGLLLTKADSDESLFVSLNNLIEEAQNNILKEDVLVLKHQLERAKLACMRTDSWNMAYNSSDALCVFQYHLNEALIKDEEPHDYIVQKFRNIRNDEIGRHCSANKLRYTILSSMLELLTADMRRYFNSSVRLVYGISQSVPIGQIAPYGLKNLICFTQKQINYLGSILPAKESTENKPLSIPDARISALQSPSKGVEVLGGERVYNGMKVGSGYPEYGFFAKSAAEESLGVTHIPKVIQKAR